MTTPSPTPGIHYEVHGDGPALVLLHGRMRSLADWHRYGYVEALERDWRLVLLDVRGHGQSTKPHDPVAYEADALADDVASVLDALELDDAAVFGYSLGGRIGFHLRARRPHRVTALVAGGAAPNGATSGRDAELRLAATFDRGIDAYIDELLALVGSGGISQRYRDELRQNDPAAMAALARATADWPSVADELAASPAPVLMFAGTADPLWPLIDEAAGRLPRARLHAFDGFGHMADLRRSDLVLPVIESFLRSTRSG